MRNTFIRLTTSFISANLPLTSSATTVTNNLSKCAPRCIDCKHSVKLQGHTLIECKAIAEHDAVSGKIRFDNIIHARSMNGNCGVAGRWFSPRQPYSRYIQK